MKNSLTPVLRLALGALLVFGGLSALQPAQAASTGGSVASMDPQEYAYNKTSDFLDDYGVYLPPYDPDRPLPGSPEEIADSLNIDIALAEQAYDVYIAALEEVTPAASQML